MKKKKLFSCFHPLVLETENETHQIKANSTISQSVIIPKDQISVQRNHSKRSFSKVLEILLHKASLKIKVSKRNCRRQLLFQPKNAALRRISKHLQKSSNDKTARDKVLEDAKVSRTQIRGRSSYESNDTRSSTAVLSPSVDRHESSEFRKSCSRRINPGLYLLLSILFFTVFLGKIIAVLFALMFLYLFPGLLR